MSREARSRRPSRRCLKRMMAAVVSSSLAVGIIFSLEWNPQAAGGRYPRSPRLPRGLFRELLDHPRPAPNRSLSPPPVDRNYLEPEDERPPDPAAGGWTVLPGNITVHLGNVSNPHDYRYLFRPRRLCRTFEPGRPAVVIFVESHADNAERRRAIRDTWGLLSLQRALNFRVVFGLGLAGDSASGLAVSRESYRYDDVLQEDFPESFRNLALKSVMGLKWAVLHCPRADYFMKTDDDLLIHVPNLLRLLEEYPAGGGTVLCHENRVRRILRKEVRRRVPAAYGKYLVDGGDLPGQFFPPYCAGLGYVFSRPVALRLYRAALATPYFFIEDVYVTGFCRRKAGVSLSDHPAIALKPAVLPRQGACAFREGRVTSQEITHAQMREMWEEINTQGYFCPEVLGYIR